MIAVGMMPGMSTWTIFFCRRVAPSTRAASYRLGSMPDSAGHVDDGRIARRLPDIAPHVDVAEVVRVTQEVGASTPKKPKALSMSPIRGDRIRITMETTTTVEMK